MSRLARGIASCSLGILFALAMPTAEAQEGQAFKTILEELNRPPARYEIQFANEGLTRATPAESLTWERAYALALVRFRDQGKGLSPTLDPKALDQQATRLGVADFDRFRREFLAGEAGGLRDPSARYFELLGRSRAIDGAVSHLAATENLMMLFQQLVMGESSGLTQIQVDEVNDSVQRARIDLIDRQARYRDALDEFKVELGLSPQAPVVLERQPTAQFRATFEELIRWSADPSRDYVKLDELAKGLPTLGDLVIEGRSLLESTNIPDRLGDVVSTAGKVAVANRGQADASTELRARRMTRKLAELAIGYRIEQRKLVLTLRRRSMAQERLIAPPQQARPDGGAPLASLGDLQTQLRDSEDRLVESWASYHSLRLTLYRDLKMLPAGDWKAFYDQILGGRDDPARRPAGLGPDKEPPAAPTGPAPPDILPPR